MAAIKLFSATTGTALPGSGDALAMKRRIGPGRCNE